MQRKIYFGNKPLFLVDRIDGTIEDYLHRQETIFIDELNVHTVKTMIHEMGRDEIYRGVFLHPDLDALFSQFGQRFTLVKAAGGVVFTPEKELLLIFRRGKWDLPKGKLDPGEAVEACALREIREETGLQQLELVRPLALTYHTYFEGDQHILKESHWFLVKGNATEPLQPQEDEDIMECLWVPSGALGPYFDHSHASVADVLYLAIQAPETAPD